MSSGPNRERIMVPLSLRLGCQQIKETSNGQTVNGRRRRHKDWLDGISNGKIMENQIEN